MAGTGELKVLENANANASANFAIRLANGRMLMASSTTSNPDQPLAEWLESSLVFKSSSGTGSGSNSNQGGGGGGRGNRKKGGKNSKKKQNNKHNNNNNSHNSQATTKVALPTCIPMPEGLPMEHVHHGCETLFPVQVVKHLSSPPTPKSTPISTPLTAKQVDASGVVEVRTLEVGR